MSEQIGISYLRMCDGCCDASGTARESIKRGGCTCDICGFSCSWCGIDGKHSINLIPARLIAPEGWLELQQRNERSLEPLDWQSIFRIGRED